GQRGGRRLATERRLLPQVDRVGERRRRREYVSPIETDARDVTGDVRAELDAKLVRVGVLVIRECRLSGGGPEADRPGAFDVAAIVDGATEDGRLSRAVGGPSVTPVHRHRRGRGQRGPVPGLAAV